MFAGFDLSLNRGQLSGAMKRLGRLIGAVWLMGGVAWADDPGTGTVQRGAGIAMAGDCTSCHTTPQHGFLAGGLPMNSPLGPIYASNITPDPAFGIGNYTRDQFRRAMRQGVAADGHRLYPAMPYASFAALSDEDIDALYDYLMQGVAPIAYKPPETRLPFPFSQRWGMALWDAVFARHNRYVPDPGRDERWNRGAYLVQGAGHCGACHTPRGPAYEERGYDETSALYLKGGVADGWSTANLTGDPASGLGRWNEDDITAFLKTGQGGGAVAFGTMKDVVEQSTQHMSDQDLQAIAHYLKSFPAGREASQFDPSARDRQARDTAPGAGAHELPGADLFQSSCSVCHGARGEGRLPGFPTLAGNPAILADDPNSVIRIVLEGGAAPATNSGPAPAEMPAFAGLTDREIAQVVSFIRADWGNQAGAVSEREVARVRAGLKKLNAETATEPNGSAVKK